MGNTLVCEPCTSGIDRSLFFFSTDLVRKYTEGRQPKPLSDAELDALDKFDDEELFRTLKCIDDSHSEAFGLTPESLQLLLQQLEQVVHEVAGFCQTDAIKSCYKRNEDCPIKCERNIKDFEQCVGEELTDVVTRLKKSYRNYDIGE